MFTSILNDCLPYIQRNMWEQSHCQYFMWAMDASVKMFITSFISNKQYMLPHKIQQYELILSLKICIDRISYYTLKR